MTSGSRSLRMAMRRAVQRSLPVLRRLGGRALRALRGGGGAPSNSTDAVAREALENQQYALWLTAHEPGVEELSRLRASSTHWAYRPLVSVVVPVYEPSLEGLDAMIESVVAQAYDNWELCLADDCSPNPTIAELLRGWAARDPRIRVTFRSRNGNIAAASNSALALASGEFVALLDHDDVLRPHALHSVVALLREDSAVDVVFSDEDKILLDGGRGQVSFKGEFDPDHLLSTNYVSHLSVFRRAVLSDLGGFRTGLDGSQDHDLVLRAVERARSVRHVPDVLYSWRQVAGSAALAYSEKPRAWTAGLRAVQDALDRRGTGAHAQYGPGVGTYTVRHPMPSRCSVRVILLSDDAGVAESSRRELSRDPGVADISWHIAGADASAGSLWGGETAVPILSGTPGQAQLLNAAARSSTADVLVFVAGDLVPGAAGRQWLAPLVEQAMRDTVGVCGGRIVAADGTAEHEGLHVGGPRIAESIGVRYPVIQGAAAVSGACLAIRRLLFEQLGGFDDLLQHSFHDVDLCLKARLAGYSCIYTPLTELRRVRRRGGHGSAPPAMPSPADAAAFLERWHDSPVFSDPYVSPWVTRRRPLVIRQG